MKTELINIRKTGYGHWQITIRFRNGKMYNDITTDSVTIDQFNSDVNSIADQKRVNQAEKRLIRSVKRANRLPD